MKPSFAFKEATEVSGAAASHPPCQRFTMMLRGSTEMIQEDLCT
jgi:hypothetical protein